VKAAPRLDGRPDHDELGSMGRGDASDLLAKASRPCAHDLPPHADAVRASDGRGRLEPLLQSCEPAVHVRVQGQLPLDDERPDENDTRPAVGGQPTGEIERVLGLLPVEQGHDDAAIGDRLRPQHKAPSAAAQGTNVRQPSHRNSW
jgi:hypothetical protein